MSRVALIGENSIGYISALIDIWNNDDCAVLVDWRIPLPIAVEMMIEADVHVCFIEKNIFSANHYSNADSIRFITYERQNNTAQFLPVDVCKKFRENYSRKEAVVIYSSGTTGKSKGIVLTHFAINTNADAIIDYMKPTAEDCLYIAKTLSHSSTLTGELLVALKAKSALVISPTVVPPRIVLKNINRFSITIMCLNPALLSLLADEYQQGRYNLSSLKSIYVSGSVLSDRIYNKVHAAFLNIPIYNVYGLSEAGPRVTAQREDCCKGNSVGKPIKGVELKVVRESDIDSPYGVIHIKTPSIYSGYIVGEEKHPALCVGWYNTGDVGYIDEYGELHVINRVDDVIIIDSHKVYPSEVEKYIIEYPGVRDCVVTKVVFNSNEFLACLYVSEKDINSDIKNKLKNKLMIYEIPRIFLKCNGLPKTNSGKVSIFEVQALFQEILRRRKNDG